MGRAGMKKLDTKLPFNRERYVNASNLLLILGTEPALLPVCCVLILSLCVRVFGSISGFYTA